MQIRKSAVLWESGVVALQGTGLPALSYASAFPGSSLSRRAETPLSTGLSLCRYYPPAAFSLGGASVVLM